ncbi:NAD dependent epimerase/dehydratase family protein [Hyaloscypha bicolor E]|uniref:NAD dependent epimerase/dehydratase family protein n=1 Tax=Hyaloscypha bicolor E TaxID=1095630 RepID=A0A2J6TMU3_9HELO|nr:NAD dependent epimerase/dehydratase family protein [Hyaloscypha bicolor E]PMD64312.1 NAD dependent epimerase/dehydratase family protein [Hyaloscypha bicolor E]
MTEPNPTRILLLGATGYIGGSILTHLINHPIADTLSITALVRKPYQASILKDAGVIPLLFKDLDDYETIYDAAREADVVIAAASARHEGSAKACLEGLSERSKTTGQPAHYVHTSGASIIGDWPVTGTRVDEKTYSDVSDDVFELEKMFEREEAGWSPVRSVNQLVVESGERLGVKTYIVVPPLIFGPGTGSFTLGFGQVHMMVQAALKRKQAVMVGAGSGVWSRIHILDLTSLYFLLTQAILDKKPDLRSGKKGFYFVENGTSSWKGIAERISVVGKKIGAFESEEVGKMSLGEAKEEFGYGSERDAEGVVGSSARIKADKARQLLGWSPTRGEGEFLEEIEDVVTAMFQQGEAE